jgi:predicted SAM-dependent methyltransferase
VKLHLGCGKKRLEGWVNVDIENADVNCDIRKLPFEDESAEKVMAIHVFEHVPYAEKDDVLAEWYRVIEPDGLLILELPCMDKVINYIRNTKELAPNMVMWPLFGDPSTIKTEHDLHKWCYSRDELASLLYRAGFKSVYEETPHYHVPARDMRLVAVK